MPTMSPKRRGAVVSRTRRVATKKAVLDWAEWEAPRPANADDWWRAVLAAKEEHRRAAIAAARAQNAFARIRVTKGDFDAVRAREVALNRRSEADTWEVHAEALLRKLLGMRSKFAPRKKKT